MAARKRTKLVAVQQISEGDRLVKALSEDGDGYGLTVIIVEAGRITDRLAKLDEIIAGREDAWARLCAGRDEVLEVRIDSALSEARQQATVLRHLIGEVHRQRSAKPPGDPGDDDLAGM